MKRIICIMLSLCMIIPAFFGLSAYAVGEEPETTLTADAPMSQVPAENAYEKIHFYFDTAEYANLENATELATATASVKTDYATALGVAQRRQTASNVNENVYITVQFVSDYMEDETYKTLKAARENAKTAAERDEAKTNLNEYSKQYHADLVAKNLPTLSAISYTAYHAIDYSSFVTLTVPAESLNAAVLEEAADKDNILHVSLTDGFEVADCSDTSTDEEELYLTAWDDVMDCINATDFLAETDANGNLLHTGEGVKVGVYETATMSHPFRTIYNTCDTQHLNLSSLAITVREDSVLTNNPYKLTHGTMVMSVLAKMLPCAEYYYANAPINMISNEQIEGLQWFIDYYCDVVNCSLGYRGSGTVYRFDIDAVYDYQIYTHDIVVVISSGNIEEGEPEYILSPGKARNAITVSGVKATDSGEWVFDSNAVYISDSSYIINPTVAAPYNVVVDNISSTLKGTSFSAPLVTGCVALYLEYHREYISSSSVSSTSMRSLLMASARKTADYQAQSGALTADQRVGAGIVNLESMLTSFPYSFTISAAAQTEFKNFSVNLTAGEELCVALNWNIDVDPIVFGENNIGTVYAPDIDLRLYDASGNLVSSSMYYYHSSTEYIRYTIPSSGNYRIVLYNFETYPVTLQYGLAYSKQ